MATAATLTAVIKGDDKLSPVLAGLQGKLNGIAAGMRKAGMAATVAGGAIVAGLGVAVKAAADFESGMREVNSMMGLGQAEFQALSDDVLKLSTDIGVNAVDATKALYQAISAGVPKGNAIEFLSIATKAAIAGVTDTETAVDGLTTVMNAFKIPLEDTQKVADIMFATVKGGKTTFAELSRSMFQVAPIAAASGVAFQEVAAALATMTKQGVPTSVATTQLRQAMVALQKPTKDMQEVIDRLGFSSGQAMLEELGLAKTLETLRESTMGSNEQLMKMFGSVEAGAAVLALTGDNAETFAADLRAMEEATKGAGAATDAFNEINKSASRQFEATKAKLQGMAISIGTKLLPVLLPLIEGLAGVIEKVVAWMDANPKLTGTIVKVVAVIGGLLLILGPLLIILPSLTTAVGLFGAALALAAGPIGWVVAGIALLATGSVLLVNKLNKVTDKTREVSRANEEIAKVMEETSKTIDNVTKANTGLVDSLAEIADGASGVTDAVGDMIAKLQFSESIAGRLNITMEDLYGILLRSGTSTSNLSRLYAEFGDDILNVNKLLEEMGLTAEEAQRHITQQENITRITRRGPQDPMQGLSPYEAALRKRREERQAEAGLPIFRQGTQSKRGGGLITGAVGQAVPIIAHAGERVLTAGQARGQGGGGGLTVQVFVEGSVQTEQDLAMSIRNEIVKIQNRNVTSGIL